MVRIRALPHASRMSDGDLRDWFCALPQGAESRDIDRLMQAAELLRGLQASEGVATTDWVGVSDPPSVGLEVAQILAELGLGTDALIAGMIYRAVREQRIEIANITALAGGSVATLVDGVLRMAAVSELTDLRDVPVLGQAAAPNVKCKANADRDGR